MRGTLPWRDDCTREGRGRAWRYRRAHRYLPFTFSQEKSVPGRRLGGLCAVVPGDLGEVHQEGRDVSTAVGTVAAGTVWSFLYYRYRLLVPLAFSHAALGSAFFYGLFGHDLAAEWQALLP